MPEDLQALHLQHEQERHTLEQEQLQEQERLVQHQQQTFQEQEQNYIRLQNEYHQDPTPQRAHEILMLEQEGKHSQELFAQQQQHVLERQQQERLRMQERQWAQEHIVMQQIQAQQLLQQQQHHQHHQQQHHQHQHQHQHEQHHYQEQQHHQHQEQQQPNFQQQQHHHQLHHHDHEQHHQQQHQHHQQQHTHQIQQHVKESDSDSEAMDVDDEVGLHSIASTITNLRQHIKPGHISPSSVAAWAEDTATQRRADDNDPDAAVILDTNILISHLNFFQSLVKSYGPTTDKSSNSRSSRRGSMNGLEKSEDVVFVVPWIVMQELDGLKGGGRQGSEIDVSGKARLAIEFLRAELSKQSSTSRLRGQKMSELVAKAEANDDKILDCCQYFRILYPDPTKTKIILFTNDKNLSVKAMVHEVEVISRFTVQLELMSVRSSISRSSKDDTSNNIISLGHTDHSGGGGDDDDVMIDGDAVLKPSNSKSSETRPRNGSRKNSSRSLNEFRAEHNDRELQRIKSSSVQTTVIPDGMDPNLFRLTNHVLKNLRRFLEAVVPDHLQARYGTKWKDITNFDKASGGHIKEEEMKWDSKRLAQPVKILQEHWVVFADVYERPSQARKARESVDRLQSFIKTWTRVEVFGLGKVYKKDVRVLLEDVDVVLSGVTTLPDSADLSSLPNTASFYDARKRITLMKDWRAECDRLHD
ncbi:PIN domain-containing protein [Linnemannia elongata]|nr:PIN domain-containing protein [Linnemannia elongata]